jgi:hypothetical protein
VKYEVPHHRTGNPLFRLKGLQQFRQEGLN